MDRRNEAYMRNLTFKIENLSENVMNQNANLEAFKNIFRD